MKRDMTAGSESKLILLFSLPIAAGNLLQQLYSTIDGIIAGNYINSSALSAIGTCTSPIILVLALAVGFGVGVNVIVSQYFGARRYKDISRTFSTAFIFMAAIGITLMLLGVLLSPLLFQKVLRVPDEIIRLTLTYFRIYCICLPFQFIYNCVAAALRGLGDSKATLYFLAVSSVTNIGLDLLFVAAFRWGVAGTAWATVLSQLLCAAVSLLYMRIRFPEYCVIRWFVKSECRNIVRLGLPSAISQSIMSVAQMAMQRLVNSYGDAYMSAYTAGSRIEQFMFISGQAFQAGLSSFTGQNVGAGNLKRVKRGFRQTVFMSCGTSVVITILLYIFARPIVSLFGLEGMALELGITQIRFTCLPFVTFAYYMTIMGLLHGSGDAAYSTFSALCGLSSRVFFGYLLHGLGILGSSAGWATMPVGWIVSAILGTLRLISGKWKNKALTGPINQD